MIFEVAWGDGNPGAKTVMAADKMRPRLKPKIDLERIPPITLERSEIARLPANEGNDHERDEYRQSSRGHGWRYLGF